jgi:O-methyltransferase
MYLEDEEFTRYYERFLPPGNWRTFDRKFFLRELLKLVKSVGGDLAECGTYQGASAYLMCEFAAVHGRRVHLFDSFEGLSEPEVVDGSWWEAGRFASPAVVRRNLAEFDCWRIHQGWIPSRFEEVADRSFAFVHVDVDLYAPTRDSIRFFFERMPTGGVMVLDDYGTHTCPGAKKAADEYFESRPEAVLIVCPGAPCSRGSCPRASSHGCA